MARRGVPCVSDTEDSGSYIGLYRSKGRKPDRADVVAVVERQGVAHFWGQERLILPHLAILLPAPSLDYFDLAKVSGSSARDVL